MCRCAPARARASSSSRARAKVVPGRARFRNWLEHAIDNYSRDVHRFETRQKRGGEATHVAFDVELADRLYAAEVRPDMSPEQALDAGLTGQLLRDAEVRLRETFVADRGEEEWNLLAPLLHGVEYGELGPIAKRLNTTPRLLSGRVKSLREILLAYCEAELAALGSQDPRGELRALAGL